LIKSNKSKEEEIDKMQDKIDGLVGELRAKKFEIMDMTEEFNREKNGLEDQIDMYQESMDKLNSKLNRVMPEEETKMRLSSQIMENLDLKNEIKNLKMKT